MITGTHIPLAALHEGLRRAAVAVAIGMVLPGDQLFGFLALLAQAQIRAGNVEPVGGIPSLGPALRRRIHIRCQI